MKRYQVTLLLKGGQTIIKEICSAKNLTDAIKKALSRHPDKEFDNATAKLYEPLNDLQKTLL